MPHTTAQSQPPSNKDPSSASEPEPTVQKEPDAANATSGAAADEPDLESELSMTDAYANLARGIPRCHELYVSLKDMFRVGAREVFDISSGEEDPDSDEESTNVLHASHEVQAYTLKVFDEILGAVPGFRDRLRNFGIYQQFDAFLASMTKLGRTARSNDTTRLKVLAETHAPLVFNGGLTPPFATPSSKTERGFNHPELARLLCPAVELEKFDATPIDARGNLLKTGRIAVNAKRWPTFLYENYKCDPKEPEKGLFRGPLFLRTYRHLFTGPRSPRQPLGKVPQGGRPTNAQLHGLTGVTPRTIAYSAVHGRFSISHIEQWQVEDGDFNYKEFYYNIIELFEDTEDPWVQETIQWLNAAIFGNCDGQKLKPETTDEASSAEWDNFTLRRAQRKAKAAAEALAQTGNGPSSSGTSAPVTEAQQTLSTRAPSAAPPPSTPPATHDPKSADVLGDVEERISRPTTPAPPSTPPTGNQSSPRMLPSSPLTSPSPPPASKPKPKPRPLTGKRKADDNQTTEPAKKPRKGRAAANATTATSTAPQTRKSAPSKSTAAKASGSKKGGASKA
ncbi:hypothetical protein BV25DRAFT_1915489 [Artomyces pyxidatus]|uniref:Uncharacterized protein n=1 Tax=Artomyces pyxidatus TaxID=48021 RepID=A0ACB8T5I1_9AGAM|nr:hypothetical protein BV25DRAFT_1915489 [Artomyces pyxidatus]